MFRTMFIQPGQTRFARPQLGHFIRLDGSPSAVQAVAAALDKAALPPGPAEPRRERWQDFTIGKSVTLIETESKVWPVSVTVASANALKHFLHGFAVANPGVVVVHDFNLPGVSAKLVFAGEDVVEHEALGGSFAWVQARPGQWLHPSATIVSDFERSRPITRLSESAFSPRRPARA